jgi:signal transduction histidine kinase
LFTSPNTGNSEDILAWSGITQRLSHEIKNPLATVVLTLQRVKTLLSSDRNENTDTTIESHLDSTLEELERIRNTTNKFISVLSLSENIFEPVDLNIFIKRVLNSMQSVPEIIRFKFVFEENMPPVECDEKQIGSLFLTIIENSVEAITDSGTITIRTRLIERLNHLNSLSKFVEVQFEDTGCGIEKNILENIFKPYNSNKDNGSGIGLYLAKRIIDKHQGYINITSKINVGTIATILIPIKHEG